MKPFFEITAVGGDVHITMADEPISRGVYARYKAECLKRISFASVSSQFLRELLSAAHVGEDAMDIFQAQSLYTQIIAGVRAGVAQRVKDAADAMRAEYDGGADVLAIASKRRFPPYRVLRAILGDKLPRETAAAIGRGTIRAADVLSARNAAQLEAASEADYDSLSSVLRMQNASQANEDVFVEILRATGLKLKTQDELIAEGSHLTPDVLFVDRVFVNRQPCKWIDFKSFCGGPVSFMAKHISQQARKYEENIGPGFMCFMHGFVAGADYPAVSARGMRDEIVAKTKKIIPDK